MAKITVSPLLKKVLKRLGIALLILLILLVIAIGGLFAFASSEKGKSYVKQTIITQLNNAGIQAQIDTLDYSLPSQIFISGVTLLDNNEAWLSFAKARIEWSPSRLFSGIVLVNSIQLEKPTLITVPAFLRPNPDAPVIQEIKTLPTLPDFRTEKTLKSFLPPLPVIVANLNISEASLNKDALAVFIPAYKNTLPEEPTLYISANASAAVTPSLINGIFAIGEKNDAINLTGVIGMQEASVKAESFLTMQINGYEKKGGVLSQLLQIPDAPAWQFSLKSNKALLTEWNGQLDFTIENTVIVAGDVSVEKNSEDDWELGIEVICAPHVNAPEVFHKVMDSGIVLDAHFSFLEARKGVRGFTSTNTQIAAPSWAIIFETLELESTGKRASFSTAIRLHLEDNPTIQQLIGIHAPTVRSQVMIDGTATAQQYTVKASGQGFADGFPEFMPKSLSMLYGGELSFDGTEANISNSFAHITALPVVTDRTPKVPEDEAQRAEYYTRTAEFALPQIIVIVQGKANLKTDTATAMVTIGSKAIEPWLVKIMPYTEPGTTKETQATQGALQQALLRGYVSATAKITATELTTGGLPKIAADVTVIAKEMLSADPMVQRILATFNQPTAVIPVNPNAPVPEPSATSTIIKHAFVIKANVGLDAINGLSYTVNTPYPSGINLTSKGEIPLHKANPTLVTNTSFTVANLGSILPDFAGHVETTISTSGALTQPNIILQTKSPSLVLPAGLVGDVKSIEQCVIYVAGIAGRSPNKERVNLQFSPKTALSTTRVQTPMPLYWPKQALYNGLFTITGDATIANRTSKAKLGFSSGWEVSGEEALLHSMQGQLFGLDIDGGIHANWKPAQPQIQGGINVATTDWSLIRSLAGVPIRSENGGVSIMATVTAPTNDAGKSEQNIDVALSLDNFVFDKPETFNTRSLLGTIALTNVFSADNNAVQATLLSINGTAAILEWDTFTSNVTGTLEKGQFGGVLIGKSLRNTTNIGRTLSDEEQATLRNPSAESQLLLQRLFDSIKINGEYNLKESFIVLNQTEWAIPSRQVGVALAKPTKIEFGKSLAIEPFILNFTPRGSIECAVAPGKTGFSATAKIKELPYAVAKLVTTTPLPRGRLNGDVAIEKTASSLSGKADIKALAFITTPQGNKQVTFDFASVLKTVRPHSAGSTGSALLTGTGTLAGPDIKKGTVDFSIPLITSQKTLIALNETAPFSLNAHWAGSVATLWGLAPFADKELTGLGAFDLTARGSLKKPDVESSLYLANGQFEDKMYGILLQGINVESKRQADGSYLALVNAHDGSGGTVALEVEITDKFTQPTPGAKPLAVAAKDAGLSPHISMRGQVHSLSPVHSDIFDISLSGVVSARGPLMTPNIGGTIVVEGGEYIFVQPPSTGIKTLKVVESAAYENETFLNFAQVAAMLEANQNAPKLDIQVHMPQHFFISGHGLESEWGGSLHITGSTLYPRILGSLDVRRGKISILSKPFEMSKGSIIFVGGREIDPDLDIELTYKGQSVTSFIRVLGTAYKPHIELSSRPEMPTDEVIAYTLFGKGISELSRYEALQVAAGVNELVNGGSGLIPLSDIKKGLGIDVLSIQSDAGNADNRSIGAGPNTGAQSLSGDDDTSASFEAGKFIADGVYVGVKQGTTEESTGVRVEIELAPNILLEGTSTGKSSEVGIGWKHDY